MKSVILILTIPIRVPFALLALLMALCIDHNILDEYFPIDWADVRKFLIGK